MQNVSLLSCNLSLNSIQADERTELKIWILIRGIGRMLCASNLISVQKRGTHVRMTLNVWITGSHRITNMCNIMWFMNSIFLKWWKKRNVKDASIYKNECHFAYFLLFNLMSFTNERIHHFEIFLTHNRIFILIILHYYIYCVYVMVSATVCMRAEQYPSNDKTSICLCKL